MKRPKFYKKLRRDAAYLLIVGFVWFFRSMPRRAALAIASLIGRAAPFFARKEVRLAEQHLKMVFGDSKSNEEIHHLAREVFRYAAMNFVDTVRVKVMTTSDMERIVVPHNIEQLKKRHDSGTGALLLSAHTGCWELFGSYITSIGYPVHVVARKLYDPRLDVLLNESRIQRKMKVISRGENTRDILRAFKKGGFVGFLIDQDIVNVKGVFVDFFGKPAHTASGPAMLALRFKVPVISIFGYRDEQHRHHVVIGDPIEFEPTGDTEQDIIELTAKMSKATEDFIREHPEQWPWFHKRWKTQPPVPS